MSRYSDQENSRSMMIIKSLIVVCRPNAKWDRIVKDRCVQGLTFNQKQHMVMPSTSSWKPWAFYSKNCLFLKGSVYQCKQNSQLSCWGSLLIFVVIIWCLFVRFWAGWWIAPQNDWISTHSKRRFMPWHQPRCVMAWVATDVAAADHFTFMCSSPTLQPHV